MKCKVFYKANQRSKTSCVSLYPKQSEGEPSIIQDSEEYININKVAQAKGLKSNRSLRIEINKLESKYISREVKVNGGISYEILFSSLEPELQQKIRECETKSTALIPLNYQPPINFVL